MASPTTAQKFGGVRPVLFPQSTERCEIRNSASQRVTFGGCSWTSPSGCCLYVLQSGGFQHVCTVCTQKHRSRKVWVADKVRPSEILMNFGLVIFAFKGKTKNKMLHTPPTPGLFPDTCNRCVCVVCVVKSEIGAGSAAQFYYFEVFVFAGSDILLSTCEK